MVTLLLATCIQVPSCGGNQPGSSVTREPSLVVHEQILMPPHCPRTTNWLLELFHGAASTETGIVVYPCSAGKAWGPTMSEWVIYCLSMIRWMWRILSGLVWLRGSSASLGIGSCLCISHKILNVWIVDDQTWNKVVHCSYYHVSFLQNAVLLCLLLCCSS